MDELGILVYCVANHWREELGEIMGLDGLHSLFYVENKGLYAVCSHVSLTDYGEDAMAEKGEDIDWLQEKAQIFMDVMLQVNKVSAIVPMKFMTIFTGEDRVSAMIDENDESFSENFHKIEGREEYSVKVYCNNEVFKETIMGDEIRAFDKSMSGKPKGAAFFLKKKFLTELDDKLQDKICKKANLFSQALENCAVDSKSNKLLAKEITGVKTPMVLNCAFLVETEKKDTFLRAVEELSAENEKGGFSLEASGPWPPYSFCE